MKLWLDDVRPPWKYGYIGWDWARTYNEALEMLMTGEVEMASLDHDLCFEDQMRTDGYKEKTGYDLMCWIEEHPDYWPEYMDCHSANPVGRARIEQVIEKIWTEDGWLPGL